MNEIGHQNGKIIHSPNAKLNWLSIFGLKVTKSVLWKIHIWLRLIARVGTLCEIQHESSGVWQNNSIPRLFTDYSHLRSQGRKYRGQCLLIRVTSQHLFSFNICVSEVNECHLWNVVSGDQKMAGPSWLVLTTYFPSLAPVSHHTDRPPMWGE